MVNATLQTFSGSHYEIGVQQGQATRGLLQKALAQIRDLEVLKQMKPRLLPTPVFLALARRRADKLLRNDIFENYPKQAQRLKGIAEGVGVSISTIFVYAINRATDRAEEQIKLSSPSVHKFRISPRTNLN